MEKFYVSEESVVHQLFPDELDLAEEANTFEGGFVERGLSEFWFYEMGNPNQLLGTDHLCLGNLGEQAGVYC